MFDTELEAALSVLRRYGYRTFYSRLRDAAVWWAVEVLATRGLAGKLTSVAAFVNPAVFSGDEAVALVLAGAERLSNMVRVGETDICSALNNFEYILGSGCIPTLEAAAYKLARGVSPSALHMYCGAEEAENIIGALASVNECDEKVPVYVIPGEPPLHPGNEEELAELVFLDSLTLAHNPNNACDATAIWLRYDNVRKKYTWFLVPPTTVYRVTEAWSARLYFATR